MRNLKNDINTIETFEPETLALEDNFGPLEFHTPINLGNLSTVSNIDHTLNNRNSENAQNNKNIGNNENIAGNPISFRNNIETTGNNTNNNVLSSAENNFDDLSSRNGEIDDIPSLDDLDQQLLMLERDINESVSFDFDNETALNGINSDSGRCKNAANLVVSENGMELSDKCGILSSDVNKIKGESVKNVSEAEKCAENESKNVSTPIALEIKIEKGDKTSDFDAKNDKNIKINQPEPDEFKSLLNKILLKKIKLINEGKTSNFDSKTTNSENLNIEKPNINKTTIKSPQKEKENNQKPLITNPKNKKKRKTASKKSKTQPKCYNKYKNINFEDFSTNIKVKPLIKNLIENLHSCYKQSAVTKPRKRSFEAKLGVTSDKIPRERVKRLCKVYEIKL